MHRTLICSAKCMLAGLLGCNEVLVAKLCFTHSRLWVIIQHCNNGLFVSTLLFKDFKLQVTKAFCTTTTTSLYRKFM